MLLTYYLDRRPDGTLAEEALALSIEAAIRRGQGGEQAFARRYLARFPDGRYAGYARQVRRSGQRSVILPPAATT